MKKYQLSILIGIVMFSTLCGCRKENGITEVAVITEVTTYENAENIAGEESISHEFLQISQGGPFGRISLSIPKGWAYELCPIDSEELVYGLYGIHIYPENVTEGYVELTYQNTFGVCGTGLEEEVIPLAGDIAYVGTYDNHAYWEFISFRGKNDNIIAQTVSPESWWSEYGDQVLEILDTLCYEPDIREGGASVYYDDSEAYEIGFMLDVKNISPTGATILYNQYEKKSTGQLEYGDDYTIERLENNQWVEVPVVVEGDYGFHDLAYLIKVGEIAEQKINWEWLYGKLEPGEYRIGKMIHDFRGTGDYDKYKLYGHFILN